MSVEARNLWTTQDEIFVWISDSVSGPDKTDHKIWASEDISRTGLANSGSMSPHRRLCANIYTDNSTYN